MPRVLRMPVAVLLLIVLGVTVVGFPERPLGLRCEVSPAADLTAHPSTYPWIDVTGDLKLTVPVTHTRGAGDEQSESNSESSFALRNNDGRYTDDNPLSDLWPGWGENTPVRLSTNTWDGSGWVQDWIQYASEIVDVPRREGLCDTYLTCAGLFRRAGQGEKLASPWSRFIKRSNPLAWWPLETGDRRETVSTPSGLSGGAALTALPSFWVQEYHQRESGVVGGSVVGPPGAPVAIDLSGHGQLVGSVPASSSSATWRFEMGVLITTPINTSTDVGEVVRIGFGDQKLAVIAGPFAPGVNTTLGFIDSVGPPVDSGVVIDNGVWHHLRVDLSSSGGGANTAYTFAIDGVVVATGTATGVNFSNPNSIVISGFGDLSGASHAEFWSGVLPTAIDSYKAFTGYADEQAHERIERLCTEEGVPFDVTATRTAVMGPQLTDTFLANLRDCESTDHGQLDDSQGTIAYRALSELYNQDPVLTIDGANKELGGAFAPTTDDLRRRNRVTAKRPGGSSVTIENLADINGVPGVRRGVGAYPSDLDVNVQDDDQLKHHAGWVALNTGTPQGKRIPQLGVNLRNHPDLLRPVRALRLGDRVQVVNPPQKTAARTVDQIVVGWSTEILGRGRRYRWIANTVPYAHKVGVYNSTDTRYDSRSTTLTADLSQTATSFAVTIAAGGVPWIQTATHAARFPLLLLIGGMVYVCTGITGTTFTIVRLPRDKGHPVGTQVHVYQPGRYAL